MNRPGWPGKDGPGVLGCRVGIMYTTERSVRFDLMDFVSRSNHARRRIQRIRRANVSVGALNPSTPIVVL